MGARWSVAVAATAALVGGVISPAWASAPDPTNGSAVVGAFGLGDGLEAAVSERDGALRLTMSVGGVLLSWDSHAIAADLHGLGHGWLLGDWTRVNTSGGVLVLPPAGGAHHPDPTHPSGLAGYGAENVVFEQREGELPARADVPGAHATESPAEPVAFTFVLHELGGLTTYFNADGDPVARTDMLHGRSDWRWDDLVPHRLVALTDADGVHTELDWVSHPGAVLITPGSNVEDTPVGESAPVWRIELDGGRLDAVVDPIGGRTTVSYDESTGLTTRLAAVSGGTTEVAWRIGDDGVARVDRLRTTDPAGAELSLRGWSIVGDGTPSSGWPAFGGEDHVFWSGDPALRYRTELSDGATRVVSEYNSAHVLVARQLVAATPSGDRTLQEQALTYPGTEDGGVADPAALPANWAQPVRTAIVHRDAVGGSRTESETFEFDDRGRFRSRTAVDGTVTTTEYDEVVPDGRRLPIGMTVAEHAIAPDGHTTTTTHVLNDARTGAIATEAATVIPGAEAAVVTAHTELQIRDDGFIEEERVFPHGDPSAVPSITRWDERVDVTGGLRTTTITTGAGTDAEASASTSISLRHGGTVMTIDPLGNRTTTTYDAIGRMLTTTDEMQRQTIVAHETQQAHGRNATTITTPDGVSRTEIRDVLNRVTSRSDNILNGAPQAGHARLVETREYPAPDTIRVADAWGAVTTTRQDLFGRPLETIAPTGLTQLTVHDDVANTVTTALTATGRLADAELWSTSTYDRSSREIARTAERADGLTAARSETGYDGLGRAVSESDGTAHVRTEWDVFGNPARTTLTEEHGLVGEEDPAATAPLLGIERRHDGFGRSLEKRVFDARSSRSGGARHIDELGRTRYETDQHGAVTSIEYTIDGLVSKRVADSGQVTEHDHHPVTRELTGVTVTAPVGDAVRTAYRHDPVTDRVIAVFDPADADATRIEFSWDAHGNLLTTTYPDGAVVAHAYDAHGRLTTTTDVADNTTEYLYDDAGRLVAAIQRDASESDLARIGYDYDAYGRIERVTRGNGVVTVYEFTSASEIAREHTSAHGRTLTERSYTYDSAGDPIERTDAILDDGADQPRSRTTTHSYDALQRLVATTEHDGDSVDADVVRSTTYEVSAAGDVVAEVVTEFPGTARASETHRQFDYDERGGLIAIATRTTAASEDRTDTGTPAVRAQSYDAAGNLIGGADGTSYVYDAANRLVSTTTPAGTTIDTEYWADGSRRALSDPHDAARTVFHWDGDTLLNETNTRSGDGGGARPQNGTAAYLVASRRHARTSITDTGAATGYYSTDRHGNVTEVTSDTGAVEARYRYRDYGTPVEADLPHGLAPGTGSSRPGLDLTDVTTNPFGYAGAYTDPDGAQFLRIRHYDHETMRFTSIDPAPIYNGYAYADLNPITHVDPSGNVTESDVIHGVVIAFAAVSAFLTLVGSGLFTGGLSLVGLGVVGVFGLFTDFGGAALAAGRIMADHDVFEVDTELRNQVEIAEYVITGIGAGIAAFKLWSKLTELRKPAAASQGSRRSSLSEGSEGSDDGRKTAKITHEQTKRTLLKEDSGEFESLDLGNPGMETAEEAAEKARARLRALVNTKLSKARERDQPHVPEKFFRKLDDFVLAASQKNGGVQRRLRDLDVQEKGDRLVRSSGWQIYHSGYSGYFSWTQVETTKTTITNAKKLMKQFNVKYE